MWSISVYVKDEGYVLRTKPEADVVVPCIGDTIILGIRFFKVVDRKISIVDHHVILETEEI